MKLQVFVEDPELKERYLSREKTNNTAYNRDVGFDIIMPDSHEIYPRETVYLDLGIKCYTPDSNGYFLVPRSSFSKLNMELMNSVGVIDPDYTGEIKAPVQFKGDTDNHIILYLMLFALLLTLFPAYLVLAIIILSRLTISKIYLDFKVLEGCRNIYKGDRLFQLVSGDGTPFEIEFVDELPETSRGEKGFGSSGK